MCDGFNVQQSRQEPLAPGWAGERRYQANPRTLYRTLARGLACWRDWLACCGLILAALALYAVTLLPGVGGRDTAEFQRVVPSLGLAHPTGYPLYILAGWLWSQLPLGGTPAWRLNFFSAATAALAVGAVYVAARALGQRLVVAAAAALALATSFTFWSQATIAEVYGLAALLQALLLLALLCWRAERWPLWPVGLLLGLGLAHHRTIVLLLPGVLVFVLLSRRPRPTELGAALAALLGPCLLYLYLPLRAPAGADRWQFFQQYAFGAEMAITWLDLDRLRQDVAARLLDLARRFVWPQLLPAGTLLALAGAARLLWRDRALALLLLGCYATVCAFCAAYYVDDVEVFFIPAHLIAVLLIGEGTMALTQSLPRPAVGMSGFALLTLPALLLAGNLNPIRAANQPDAERAAREILAQPLLPEALVIGDWYSSEGLRYLQAIEGQRPDLQFAFSLDRRLVLDTLASGRAVYLLNPAPELGLAQVPAGALWQVEARPLEALAPASFRWEEGITLAGYTLPPGPYQPGAAVPVTLAWEAQATPSRPYTLFVHLVGPDGTIWGQQDRLSTVPTDQWRPGERLVDLHTPALDQAAPPGRYRVTLGWYASPSMARLPLAGGGDYITLGEIEVVSAQ